ncbi:hypothetical protein [Caballeronia sp. NK8]|uniref:hypothetical protein n=1 Tax=Caballeronia sp. NK8 TaxID=140098 RepID=UPI001BCDA1A3|nr:hypothetical protein [Caballeronia sp. NK8]
MRAAQEHRCPPKCARRLTRFLSLALYMTDPIRQAADEWLVAEYFGATGSNPRGPIVTAGSANSREGTPT